tara:strand:+ start:66 stop:545 length:480 start_codon:yes stop_codon:yes gene_type:complete
MSKATKHSNLHWLWLSLAIVILDQFTKWWVSRELILGELKQSTPFFDFVLAHNYGAAFSFLDIPGGLQRWLFAGISLVVSIVLIIWLRKTASRIQSFCLALVIGGAVGNLLGRAFSGYVVDFLSFHIGEHYWPAFNVADAAVCVGAVLLALTFIFSKKS